MKNSMADKIFEGRKREERRDSIVCIDEIWKKERRNGKKPGRGDF